MRSSHTFDRYSDTEWANIQRAVQSRKDCPPGLNWSQIRFDLEQIGRDYWVLERQHARKPSTVEYARLHDLIKQVQDIEIAFPVLGHQLRAKLEPAYRWITAWAKLLEGLNSRHFQRTANLFRKLLYSLVLGTWHGPLRGELGTSHSTSIDGIESVTGPLVRFFEAAVNPILGPGKALSRPGIRKIIRGHSDDLKDYHAEFWKGRPTRRWDRPADLDEVIRHGRYDLFGSDRLNAVRFVVNGLIRQHKTEDEIVAVLLDKDNRISDHVYDQKDAQEYARRQVARAREAVAGDRKKIRSRRRR